MGQTGIFPLLAVDKQAPAANNSGVLQMVMTIAGYPRPLVYRSDVIIRCGCL